MEEPRWTLFLIFGGTALVMALVGIPLALDKVGPNSLYGVRFPSTLENPRIWYEVNRKVGREATLMGSLNLVVCVALFFLPVLSTLSYALICTALLVVMAVTLLVRSLVITSRSKRRLS